MTVSFTYLFLVNRFMWIYPFQNTKAAEVGQTKLQSFTGILSGYVLGGSSGLML